MTLRLTSSMRPVDACAGKRVFSRSATAWAWRRVRQGGPRAWASRCGDRRTVLFTAGMRRSEVSALRWADVADATDGDGILVTVRRSKTNQEGEVNDVGS